MPRLPTDYSRTIMYKIVCNDLSIQDCYVGHTTRFIARKACHKHNCYNETYKEYNKYLYQFIRENGGWCNWSMIQIEEYPCNNANEARARERYWYETLSANLNCQVPNRTESEYSEYSKEYRKNNVEYFKDYKEHYNKKYYDLNKDKINEYKRTNKIECECGCFTSSSDMSKHRKSQKHKKLLSKKENENEII